MKFKTFLMFSLLCVGTCSSCSDDTTTIPEPKPDPEPEEKPVVPPVTIEFPNNKIPQLAFVADGGKEQVHFYTTGGWEASLSADKGVADWISFSPSSGGKGYHMVEVVSAASDQAEVRKAVLCLITKDAKAEIPIVQEGGKVIQTDQNHIKVDNVRSSFLLSVKANVGYKVEIEVDWIHLQASKALTESKLEFVVDRNGRQEERTGKIVLASEDGSVTQTIVVLQVGKDSSVDDWEPGNDDWWKPDEMK